MLHGHLLWALVLTALTVTCHALYTFHAMGRLHRNKRSLRRPGRKEATHSLDVLIQSVLMLLALHCLETSFWAVYYLYEGGLPDFATSLYFSMVTFATTGYGDIVLAPSLRLVGAMEGIVGTFMSGWSVALLVSILQVAAAKVLGPEDSDPERYVDAGSQAERRGPTSDT
jgi:hypothetical protein